MRLHADLGAKLLENKKQGEKIAEDMKAVETVIRLFDSAYDIRRIAVRRRYKENPLFPRGTVFRAAMDVLRTATAPMTSREICIEMLKAKGISEPTPQQLAAAYGGVHSSLHFNDGNTVARVGEGSPQRWTIKTVR